MSQLVSDALLRVVLLNPGVRFVEDGFAQSIFGFSLNSQRVISLIIWIERNNFEKKVFNMNLKPITEFVCSKNFTRYSCQATSKSSEAWSPAASVIIPITTAKVNLPILFMHKNYSHYRQLKSYIDSYSIESFS